MWAQRAQICAGLIESFYIYKARSKLHVRITSQNYLPKTPRLLALDLEPEPWGPMMLVDICVLFLEDLTDLIKCCIDIGFDFGNTKPIWPPVQSLWTRFWNV